MGQLNRMRISDANQKFSDMIRLVDQGGIVYLTKRNEDKYVIMTKEIFNEFKEDLMNTFVITDELVETIDSNSYMRRKDNGNVIRIWIEKEALKIVELQTGFDVLEGYKYYTIPLEKITISDGDTVTLNVSEPDGDSVFHMSSVDFSMIDPDEFESYAISMMVKNMYDNIPDTMKDVVLTGCKWVVK